MIDFVKKDTQIKLAILIFSALTIWWVYLNFINFSEENTQRQLFAAVYGFMALFGAVWGFDSSKKWGGFSSVLGKSLLMFSLGLFLQEFGQLAYSYYIYFLKIEVPYPSWGDFGYFMSIPCYIYGTYLLGKTSGAKFTLKAFITNPVVIIIPVIILGASYYVFLLDYELDLNDLLKLFLDFGYPLGQSIYISLALVAYFLSKGVLGGLMKSRILFILFALLVQYTADYSFLWQFSKGEWLVGGVNDYIYLIAYFSMTVGLLRLRHTISELG